MTFALFVNLELKSANNSKRSKEDLSLHQGLILGIIYLLRMGKNPSSTYTVSQYSIASIVSVVALFISLIKTQDY